MTIEQAIEQYDGYANVCMCHNLTESQEEFEQLAAWLRELRERRKADSCEGCMHKYGEKLTCQICARYYRDKYVAERRADADD